MAERPFLNTTEPGHQWWTTIGRERRILTTTCVRERPFPIMVMDRERTLTTPKEGPRPYLRITPQEIPHQPLRSATSRTDLPKGKLTLPRLHHPHRIGTWVRRDTSRACPTIVGTISLVMGPTLPSKIVSTRGMGQIALTISGQISFVKARTPRTKTGILLWTGMVRTCHTPTDHQRFKLNGCRLLLHPPHQPVI